MSVKIYKRSSVLKNLVFFVALSFVYYHIVLSLFHQTSAIEWSFTLTNAQTSTPILVLGFLSLISIWYVWPISKYLTPLFMLLVFFKTFSLFFISFDKVLLLLNFTYLVFAFYFWLFWKLELKEAHYHPGFNQNDIEMRPKYDVKVEVVEEGGKVYLGWLTNWDESSCYILLNEKWVDLRGKIKVLIKFEKDSFQSEAQIVSSYGPGIGVKFNSIDEKKSPLGWSDFYDIMSDRGYLH